MEEQFKDKIAPVKWLWCIINNLQKFDNKPEYILELVKKFRALKEHYILDSFRNIIEAIDKEYKQYGKFPDVEKLKIDFRDIRAIVISNDKFSMQIYEALMKYIDQEILRQRITEKIVDPDNIDVEDIRRLSTEMSRFADRSTDIPKETKKSLIESYENYSASFDGIKTYIKPLDDVIGVLGYQSLSTFAAPTGHGKSTFAMSTAYYNVLSGKCVEYCSFEIPAIQVWFNMISMDTEGTTRPLPASKIKCSDLTSEEAEEYKEQMTEFLGKIKASGGYLSVMDQTTAGVNTFEGFCAKLEARAEERGRKADLIIIDNIDNFQIFRSNERDEVSKINNYIISLDAYAKNYCDGAGTAILLLSQVNRPAMKKLYNSANDDSKSVQIDVTCVQKYNALYEKSTCVLVGFADEAARSSGLMRIHPVKLRNTKVPEQPVRVKVNYEYSKVLGAFESTKYTDQQDYEQNAMNAFKNGKSTQDFADMIAED